jgi:hypothetical protein
MITSDLCKQLDSEDYKFLGWANGWLKNPTELQDCIKSGCSREHKHHSKDNRGTENVVVCTRHKYYYKYDSSD